jgi:hypothetical protein
MTKRTPVHAICDRLLSDVEAWLPSTDSASRQQIVDLLTQAAATGADPIATLRDGLRQWFGTGAPAMLSRSPSPIAAFEAASIPLEALIGLRHPTLWPQRPKRLVDEVFSSWLWRCATASHVSPALFAADVLGSPHGDIDRDVAPETVRRLARLSGQTFASLAAGTLPLTPAAPQDTIGGMVEDFLMTGCCWQGGLKAAFSAIAPFSPIARAAWPATISPISGGGGAWPLSSSVWRTGRCCWIVAGTATPGSIS